MNFEALSPVAQPRKMKDLLHLPTELHRKIVLYVSNHLMLFRSRKSIHDTLLCEMLQPLDLVIKPELFNLTQQS